MTSFKVTNTITEPLISVDGLEIQYKGDDLLQQIAFPSEGDNGGRMVAVAIDQGRSSDWDDMSLSGDLEDKDFDSRDCLKQDLHVIHNGVQLTCSAEDVEKIAVRSVNKNLDEAQILQKAFQKKAQEAVDIVKARDCATMYDCIKGMQSPQGESWLVEGINNISVSSAAWNTSSATPYDDVCNACFDMQRRGGNPEVLLLSPEAYQAFLRDSTVQNLFKADDNYTLAQFIWPEMSNQNHSYVGGKIAAAGCVLQVLCDNSRACPTGFACLLKRGFGEASYYCRPFVSKADSVVWTQGEGSVPEIGVLRKDLHSYQVVVEHDFTCWPQNVMDVMFIDTQITSPITSNAKEYYYVQLKDALSAGLVIDRQAGTLEAVDGKVYRTASTTTLTDTWSIGTSAGSAIGVKYIVNGVEMDSLPSSWLQNNMFYVNNAKHALNQIVAYPEINFAAGSNVTAITACGTLRSEYGERIDMAAVIVAAKKATFASTKAYDHVEINGVTVDENSVITADKNITVTVVGA